MATKATAQGKGRKTSKTTPAEGDPRRGGSSEPTWLRTSSYRRTERRFTPNSSTNALIGVVGSGAGALLLGAGVFAQFVRKVGPHPYGLYFLLAGAIVFIGGVMLTAFTPPTVRVGDAGVGVEKGGGVIDRLAWHEITAAELSDAVLSFRSSAKTIALPTGAHPEAAALALHEARARIPGRVAAIQKKLEVARDAGKLVVLEAPQLAGLHCKASGRLIAFQADARLCGRCEETYHKDDVPPRCATCDAALR